MIASPRHPSRGSAERSTAAGRWAGAVPRPAFHVGYNLRENRRGPGPESPTRCCRTQGFGFAEVQIYASPRLRGTTSTTPSGCSRSAGARRWRDAAPGGGEHGRGSAPKPGIYAAWQWSRRRGRRSTPPAARRRPSRPRSDPMNCGGGSRSPLERLREPGRRAAKLGVERFVLDDGGSRRRHDERDSRRMVSARRGRRPPSAVDTCGARMQFGLGRAEMSTRFGARKGYHGWVMSARQNGRALPPPEGPQPRHTRSLEHVKAASRDRRRGGVDFFSVGPKPRPRRAGTRRGGRRGCTLRQRTFYRLLDELRSAHPTLEIGRDSRAAGEDDLASSNAPIGSGVDCTIRRGQTYAMTTSDPPEYLGSHIDSASSKTTVGCTTCVPPPPPPPPNPFFFFSVSALGQWTDPGLRRRTARARRVDAF